MLLAFLGAVAPALAGSPPQTSGNAAIDAQWREIEAWRSAQAPVDPNARARRGLFGIFHPQAPRAAWAAPAYSPPQPREIDPAFLPAIVAFPTQESPGTILIDTRARYLYLVLDGGKARRYGVGVGREGFGWTGRVTVGRKVEWPTWTPPAAMRKRQPYLPVSMAGGPDNPLGARALYLTQGGRDTLFRIHGSNEPWTIGHAVSSGCFRMRNEDVIDLYGRVRIGASVVVL
jgi:lipoprotein-anchoring transpeptidase ErfK/SrfK